MYYIVDVVGTVRGPVAGWVQGHERVQKAVLQVHLSSILSGYISNHFSRLLKKIFLHDGCIHLYVVIPFFVINHNLIGKILKEAA